MLSLSYTLSAFFNFWNPLVKRLNDVIVLEAQAMTNYALKQGVPERDIILEHQSTNTEENIRFSVALMTGQKRFAVVTNYYHLFRALLLPKNKA